MKITKETNCWEYRDCKVKEKCPAWPIFGKICFSVKGTLCDGQVQGDYGEKIARCRLNCDFYKARLDLA